MAVPKKRTTKSKRNMRRSHHRQGSTNLTNCSHCSQPIIPHHACPNCGTYKEHEVIDVMAKLDKKERQAKQKELAQQQNQQQDQ